MTSEGLYRDLCAECGARRIDLQIGLERSIADYIDTLVGVFREVWRVLHPTGCVFLNIGDTYYSNPAKGGSGPNGKNGYGENYARGLRGSSNSIGVQANKESSGGNHYRGNGGCDERGGIGSTDSRIPLLESGGTGISPKAKDLCLIPERLAIALQADGWYVRSRIAWVKDNPMPESCNDRPTSAWEHVYLLAKSPRYFWDAEAVREPSTPDVQLRAANGYTRGANGKLDASRQDGASLRGEHVKPIEASGHNLRNWWQINPEPRSETYCVACDLMYDRSPAGQVCVRCKGKLTAHYAAFPTKLVEQCIKAGTPERGVCSVCLTPWVRELSVDYQNKSPNGAKQAAGEWQTYRLPERADRITQTLGWRPQCSCEAPTHPALVCDPFGGTATTGIVAESLGRRWIITELSWPYCRYSQRRTSQRGLFA